VILHPTYLANCKGLVSGLLVAARNLNGRPRKQQNEPTLFYSEGTVIPGEASGLELGMRRWAAISDSGFALTPPRS